MLDAPDYARMTALVFSYTDPTDPRLRREISEVGRIGIAKILTGDHEIPAKLSDWTELPRWIERVGNLNPEHELAKLADRGIRFVIPGDDEWPEQLDDLEFPPFGLYVGGDKKIPGYDKMIALIGSRDATAYGLSVTGDLTSGLVGRGHTIVSGGAYGIDAAAHRGSLSYGTLDDQVPTIAVLAGGTNLMDRFYPTGNADLLHQVMKHGLVITETPVGMAPTRKRFLDRNRIIAALCVSTVVVEARWRSGAMSTAAHARKLGRLVGAVPGSVYSANSAGTHRLIREFEAQLVTDAADIVELEYFHTER